MNIHRPDTSRLAITLCCLYIMTFLIVNVTGTSEGIFGLQQASRITPVSGDIVSSGLYVFGPIYVLAILQYYINFNVQGKIMPGDWIIYLLFFFSSISALWSVSPMMVFKSNIHFIGLLFIAANTGFVLAYNKKIFILIVMLSAGLISLASIALVVFSPNLAIIQIGDTGRWTGITRQPNTLGMMAMIGIIPCMYMVCLEKRISMKMISILVLLLNVICILGSKSITSLAISLCVIIGFPLYKFIINSESFSGSAVKLFSLLWLLVLCIVCINFINPTLFDVEHILNFFGRDKSLTGRVDLWSNAWSAFKQRPLLGWGFDNLASLLSSEYKQKITYGQLHNGYLDILVRGGLVGFVLTISLLGSIVVKLIATKKIDPMIYALQFFIFFAVIVHNLSEASFMRNPSTLWWLFLSIYFSSSYLYTARMSNFHTMTASENRR